MKKSRTTKSLKQSEHTQIYKTVSSKLHIKPSPKILQNLKHYHIKTSLDSLEERDIKTLCASLPKLQLLIRFHIWGKEFENVALNPNSKRALSVPGGTVPPPASKKIKADHAKRKYKFPNPNNKSATEIHSDPGTVCFSRNTQFTYKVMKALSSNLSSNKCLSELKLVGLKVSKESWSLFGTGLKGNSPIEYLAITYCKLKDQELELFAPSLMHHQTLRKLDLSNNQLSSNCGFDLSRIINKHSERKDLLIWAEALRGKPQTIPQSGLQELCLTNNHICDKTVLDLCGALYHDTWLRTLDLRRNKVSKEGLQELSNLLHTNHTLILLDVRENEQLPPKLGKFIVNKLKKNLKKFRKTPSNHPEVKWEQKLEELQKELSPLLTTEVPDPNQPIIPKSNSDSFLGFHKIYEVDEESCLSTQRLRKGSEHPPLQQTERATTQNCPRCYEFEQALFRAESNVVSLNLENSKLRKQLEGLGKADSWSNSLISQGQVESLTNKLQPGITGEESDVLNRIEQLMGELTRLMDTLEYSRPQNPSNSWFRLPS